MKTIAPKLKKALQVVKSYFPTKLPEGVTEFDVWSTDIIKLSGLPFNESMKFAVAAMIINMRKDDEFYIPKRRFVQMLRVSAARQVSGFVMYEAKEKQKKAQELAEKAANEAQQPGV